MIKSYLTELPTPSENPVEVAALGQRLAEEIMGLAATKPVNIQGFVVP